jgi:1-acyl-sn-glycerol-3-phosphate acyltransferase
MKTIFLMLRSILFYVGYAISVIIVGGLSPILGLFLPRDWVMRGLCIPWCDWAVWWARVTCGIRFRVIGREHIPAGACVVLSKHQSAWETLYVQSLFYPAATVLKQELLSIPFFGWGLRAFEPIAINRAEPNSALKAVIRQGEEKLKLGRRVVIFPEGTRTLPGEVTTYSVGGAMLATKTGALAVPVALNSGDCWPRGKLIKTPGLITVVIGEPIDSTQLGTKALNEKARQWIEQTVAEIRRPD